MPCGGSDAENNHGHKISQGTRLPAYGFRQERFCLPGTVVPWIMNENPLQDVECRPEPARATDFVAVDDAGAFSHHCSRAELISIFEYPGEVICILDRQGRCRRLLLDSSRTLVLSGIHGAAEFSWLQQNWTKSQQLFPRQHRIRRFHALTLECLVADIFETLSLGQHTAELGGSAGDLVHDHYGHTYKVVSHPGSGLQSGRNAGLWYVEVKVP